MATRHLIVGAGPAGVNAIQTLRAIDTGCEITLVCDEPAYARMVLPYFLEGKIEERAVMTGDARWFESLGVSCHLGVQVSSVDPGARRVTLDDGNELDYDRMLLATGSRAARPSIEGLDGSGVINLWTLGDVKAFLAEPRPHTVIVGAGFIAFTVLDAIITRSERVTFLEIESQVLPNMLDAASAALMKGQLEDRGVEVRTGVRLERIEQTGGRRRLQLSGGDSLDCDAVVVAAGVAPNVEFLEGSGIELGSGPGAGILVDDRLQSSAEGVYAAGDVAQAADLQSGERRVHAVQPTAVDHGRVAAANMAGEDVRYAGSLIMNILAAEGLEACSFGDWRGEDRDVTVVENTQNRIYRKYVWSDDVLVGGILVGPTLAVTSGNDVGMLKGLIQTAAPLGPWRAYLEANPLDLRRVYVASSAGARLLESTLLTGRVSTGGGFRFPSLPAMRKRSPHHETLLTGKPA
jgi:NAD(P)H-nitrite reductase large subunit